MTKSKSIPINEIDLILSDLNFGKIDGDDAKAQIMSLLQEARIEETKLWYDVWGKGEEQIGDGTWEDFYEWRMSELKHLKAGGE